MAKQIGKPAWKSKWPRDGDLKTWFVIMLQKCEAIADDDTAAEKAHLPIDQLARMGYVQESLRWVNRFLRRVPRSNVLTTVRLAELGAKICLDANDLPRMEVYLALAEATEPLNTRRCDKGFSLDSVRQFRANHGLLDPADAIDNEERVTATFEGAYRRFEQSRAQNRRSAALAAVAEMENAAHEADAAWTRQFYLGRVIDSYAKLKDAAAVKRCMRHLNSKDRDEVLNAEMLQSLGMQAEAIARTKKDIASELKQLRTMTDPNIHFPVFALCRALAFLVRQGEKAEARIWLHRAIKEMPKWPAYVQGAITSGVYHSLAQETAKIDGPAAAKALMQHAKAEAQVEKHRGFRQSSVNDALQLQADLEGLEVAIAEARQLRSPTQRRQQLARLLAQAQRWKEMREVLSQMESPEEAAEAMWWIKFVLPGGEAR